jgi:hypothetical protein
MSDVSCSSFISLFVSSHRRYPVFVLAGGTLSLNARFDTWVLIYGHAL